MVGNIFCIVDVVVGACVENCVVVVVWWLFVWLFFVFLLLFDGGFVSVVGVVVGCWLFWMSVVG